MNFFILYKNYLINTLKNKKVLIVLLFYFILIFLFVLISGKVDEIIKSKFSDKSLVSEIQRNFGDIRIIIPYAISILLLPIVALINTFNLLVNEINSGSLRYLVNRTKRSYIYIAKLLSEITYTNLAILFSFLLIVIFLSIKGDISFGYFSYALLPLLVLFLYSSSFISLFLMINTFSKNQFSSLFYSLLSLSLLILFMQFNILKYLSIFYYVPDIGNETLGNVLLKILGFLAFIILTSLMGIHFFKRRSL